MMNSKRKTRSDKFPLTLHPTGKSVTLGPTRRKRSKNTWLRFLKEPLVWAKRIVHRYVRTRHPNTGIS